MPNHKSAEKRDRQIARRNAINGRNRRRMRTELKKLRSAIVGGKREDATKLLPSVISIIDRSVQKGVLHQNAAARYKSRLTLKVNALNKAPQPA
ncbi:MAG: 30S ribosomal protein S20 [Acidobacteriota bacterium]